MSHVSAWVFAEIDEESESFFSADFPKGVCGGLSDIDVGVGKDRANGPDRGSVLPQSTALFMYQGG